MVMLTSFASFSMVPSDCEWRERGPREEPASQLDGGAVLPLPQNQVAAVEGAAIEVAKAECRPFVAFRGRKPLHLLEAVLDPVAGPLRHSGQAFGHQPAHVVAVRRPRPARAGEVRTPAKFGEGGIAVGVHVHVPPAVDRMCELRAVTPHAGGVHGPRSSPLSCGSGPGHRRGGESKTQVDEGVDADVENDPGFDVGVLSER